MNKSHHPSVTTGRPMVSLAALLASLILPSQLFAQTTPVVANNTSNLPAPAAGGTDSVATGYGAAGAGNRSVANGEGASATGTGSVAVGNSSIANGVVNAPTPGNQPFDVVASTTAVGQASQAIGNGSTAVGQGSFANGSVTGAANQASVVFGYTTAIGQNAAALGQNSTALGQGAVAYGNLNAFGNIQTGYTTALGQGAQAMGSSATAVGQGANATSDLDTAIGQASIASGVSGTAVGQAASASDYGAAVGNFATAGAFGAALGYQAHAQTYSTATGTLANVQGYYGVGIGYSATVPSNFSVAIGQRSSSSGDNGLALGSYASTGGDHSVALGADSHDQGVANVVSLGNPELTRRIIYVTPGIDGTDAVNVNQLQTVQTTTSNGFGLLAATAAANFGGGSAVGATPYSGITAPSYMIQGNTYHDVGSALQGIDTALTSLAASQGSGGGNAGPSPAQYSSAAAPTTANPGMQSNDATLVGSTAAPVTLHNVAAGVLAPGSTDAVNGGQLATTNLNVSANAAATNVLSAGVTNGTIGVVQRTATENRVAVTAPGGNGAAPGTAQNLTNIAAGAITATSADAVNGAQLYVTNQNVAAATTVANAAMTLNQNSVQYDSGARAGVTFDPGGAPAQLHNVATGVSASDAVNVAQLNSGLAASVATSKQYADQIGFTLQNSIRDVSRRANAGVAAAMAAQSAPFAPGKWSYSASMGYYAGETAIGGSLRRTAENGRWSVDAGVSRGSYRGVAVRAGVAGVLN